MTKGAAKTKRKRVAPDKKKRSNRLRAGEAKPRRQKKSLMETEAFVRDLGPGVTRTVGESLKTEFVHVNFRVPEFAENQSTPKKVTIKDPEWISELQPAAPVGGYLMECGEFSTEFLKDPRLGRDLRVTVEVND